MVSPLAGAVVCCFPVIGLLALPASASTVPFKDPSAVGYIGFCDKDKNPVTHGTLDQAPPFWTAVSSDPVPKGYEKGKATLYAYQPREGVDPGFWSANQLTASSTFSNPDHPMAQFVDSDQALMADVQAFPPEWKGLIQFRMQYSAFQLPPYVDTYPATVIQVKGNSWKVVQGGSADCHAGTSVSSAARYLKVAPSASSSPGNNASGTSDSSTSGGSSGRAAGASEQASNPSSSTGVIVGVAIAVVAGGLAVIVWRRVRSAKALS